MVGWWATGYHCRSDEQPLKRDGAPGRGGVPMAAPVTLPEAMREELRRYFETNEKWLSRVLTAGR